MAFKTYCAASLRFHAPLFRLIKEFDREIKDEESRNPPEVNKQLNDEKQSMVSSSSENYLD